MTIIEKQVDAIRAAAADQNALLQVAVGDALAAFIRACTSNRSTAEAIQLLANWRATFEKLERRDDRR